MKQHGQPKRRGRRPTKGLTKAQQRTLKAIRDFKLENGYPPSIKDLGDILGITAAGAHDQVDQLVKKGYLTREPRKARSIMIIRDPGIEHSITAEVQDMEKDNYVTIPLLNKLESVENLFDKSNVVGEILVEAKVAKTGQLFALQLQGDRLKNINIHEGDILIFRRQPLAENSDIILALLDNNIYISRLFIADAHIQLRWENDRYRSIVIKADDDIKIIGKMVGVKRFPVD
ncbi:repressor LexA [bacterium]|nr:repressor LexA [candidate division CSSED10-310 bacterium]